MLLLLFSFVCCYFSTPNLALRVLVRIHVILINFILTCSKQKKKVISFIIKEYKVDGTTLKI